MKEDGTNDWVFESLDNPAAVHAVDSKLFWIGLYAPPVAWVALFIIGILKFNIQWLIIDAVAIVLSTANIVGYTKCSKDSKGKVRPEAWVLPEVGSLHTAYAALTSSSFAQLRGALLL